MTLMPFRRTSASTCFVASTSPGASSERTMSIFPVIIDTFLQTKDPRRRDRHIFKMKKDIPLTQLPEILRHIPKDPAWIERYIFFSGKIFDVPIIIGDIAEKRNTAPIRKNRITNRFFASWTCMSAVWPDKRQQRCDFSHRTTNLLYQLCPQ